MNSHRHRAVRKTVTWQAASLAMLAGAIGLAALPLGRALGPGAHREPKGETGSAAGYEPIRMTEGVLRLTAESMRNLSGVVKVEPPKEEPKPDESEAVAAAAPAPAASGAWTYTGFMRGRGAKKAMVTVGPPEAGNRAMLSEGQAHEGTKVLEIHPDYLMVEEPGGNQKRVELAARSLAWDASMPKRPLPARPTAAATPGMPGAPNPAMGQPGGFAPPPNAAAMAEAQRRMKAAIAPQPQPPAEAEKMAKGMGNLSTEQRESLLKIMAEPGLSPEERNTMLRELGMPVDMSPEERSEYLKKMGVDEGTDPKLFEMMKEGGEEK